MCNVREAEKRWASVTLVYVVYLVYELVHAEDRRHDARHDDNTPENAEQRHKKSHEPTSESTLGVAHNGSERLHSERAEAERLVE